ncbi:MAG: PRD domain-containing protein [Erysipelothrix sp.]
MTMIYSPRLLEILKVLVQHDDYVSTHVLAESLGISNRTVFREVQNVNELLTPFNISLESKSGFGFKLRGSPEDINRFIHNLESSKNQMSYRNAEERRELLMIECLMQTSMIKLSNLATIFYVSEGTLSRDLDIIEKKLKASNLTLIRKQGYGIEIEGTEENVRKAIIDSIHKQLSQHQEGLFDHNHQDVIQYFQNQESGILGLLNQETIYNVIDVLEHSSTQIVNRITEHSYIGLVIHLSIAVERIRAKDGILSEKDIPDNYEDEALIKEARIIISDIESRFNVIFPKSEVGYVLMHLKGTRPRNSSQITQNQFQDNYECVMMVESLISRFSNLTHVDYRHDEILSIGLLAHLKPTLNRIDYGLEIRNPLLEEIKEQYRELFLIVKDTTEILYLENNLRLSDDEIGYLTLHFGAALERQKLDESLKQSVNIGVVCASGIGISALLASRIKSTFRDANEVIPLSVDDVNQGNIQDIDLLVATLDIESTLPIVNVNSLLRNEDILAVRKALDSVTNTERKQETRTNSFDKHLVDSLDLIQIDLNMNKEKVINQLIEECEDDELLKQEILEAVMNREKHGSVIIEGSNFVMYHAKVKGLSQPKVLFFRNSRKTVHKDYVEIQRGVLMIVPYPSDPDVRRTMSAITASIIDCDNLMDAIDSDNKEVLIEIIHKYMEEKMYGK